MAQSVGPGAGQDKALFRSVALTVRQHGSLFAPHDRCDVLDPDVLDCLLDVLYPEVEVSVVHLGLVYRAVRTPGRVDVDLTLTARTCPLGGRIIDDARDCLGRRFNDCPTILVRLV